MPPPSPPRTIALASPLTRVSSGLSGTLQGFMWVAAGTSLIVALVAIGGIGALDSAYNNNGSWSDVQFIDDTLNAMLGVQTIVALVIFVLIIIWNYRVYVVSEAISQTHRSFSSGWAIGAWFIPVGNALLPRLVLRDIEKAVSGSVPSLSNGQPRSTPPAAIGWTWWVLFVVFNALHVLGFAAFDDPSGDYDSWQLGYVLLLIGGAGLTASSVLGALYIRGLTRAINDSLADASRR